MSLKNLKIYTKFANQHGRRLLNQQSQDRRLPIAETLQRPQPDKWSDNDLTVAWIGHATVLINFYGTWLLTDPVMRSQVGVNFVGVTIGPRRLVHPALSIKELPALDAILVSHAHMDHCDMGTLQQLPRRTRAVVQEGNRDLVRRFSRADELKWGEATEVNGARVEAVQGKHWGARKLTDKHRGYGGFP